MRKHTLGGLLALVLVAPTAALAGILGADLLRLQPESKIWVEGTSTVRGFQCTAEQVDASIDADADASAAVLTGTKAVRTVSIRIPTQKLDCGNSTMNAHMLKALKANEAPAIAFRLASYELAPKSGEVAVRMNGALSLGGVERPITLAAEARPAASGLKLVGAKQIRMSDYGLKAPSLMMGTMKVGDQVTVKYDLLLK